MISRAHFTRLTRLTLMRLDTLDGVFLHGSPKEGLRATSSLGRRKHGRRPSQRVRPSNAKTFKSERLRKLQRECLIASYCRPSPKQWPESAVEQLNVSEICYHFLRKHLISEDVLKSVECRKPKTLHWTFLCFNLVSTLFPLFAVAGCPNFQKNPTALGFSESREKLRCR